MIVSLYVVWGAPVRPLYSSLGVKECKLSTKKHVKRKLQTEFGDLILFENLLDTIAVFIVPANSTSLQIARYMTTILLENAKLVGKTHQSPYRALFQAFSCCSDGGNWPGD